MSRLYCRSCSSYTFSCSGSGLRCHLYKYHGVTHCLVCPQDPISQLALLHHILITFLANYSIKINLYRELKEYCVTLTMLLSKVKLIITEAA